MSRLRWPLFCFALLALAGLALTVWFERKAPPAEPARPESPRDRLAHRIAQLDEQWRNALKAGGERAAAAPSLIAQAVALREELHRGDRFGLATSLQELAVEILNRCSPPPALQAQGAQLLSRVVDLSAGEGEDQRLWRAAALETLSTLSRGQGQWEKAERYARQALDVYERSYGPDSPQSLDALLALAVVLADLGRYAEARQLFERALRIVGEPRRESFELVARIYDQMGELYRVANRYDAAEEDLQDARRLAAGADPSFLATLANDFAGLYKDRGEYYRAESELRLSFNELKRSRHTCPIALATAKLNLAEVLRLQGAYDRAKPYYDAALDEAAQALGDEHPDLTLFYNQLAAYYAEQGSPEVAEEYYRVALTKTQRAHGDRHPLSAQILHDLADLKESLGKHSEAQELYRRALSIRELFFGADNPDVATTLTRLAASLFHAGRVADALRTVERAIPILGRPGAAYPETLAEAYELRSEIERRLGHTAAALVDLRRSLEIVEEQRPRLGGGEQARARFLARYKDWFHRLVQWEVEAGDIERAFEYAERSRARVLLDQLLAVRLDLMASIPEPARRRELADHLASARARLTSVYRRIKLLEESGAPTSQMVASYATLQQERDEADQEVEEAEEEIRSASPLWKAIDPKGPVSLAAAQSQLVPRGGLLLLYETGADGSFLFVVPEASRKATVVSLKIPPAAAAALGISPGALTSSSLERALIPLLQLLGRHPDAPGGGAATRGRSLAAALHALWDILVPEPVREQVLGSSQAVVIPDGFLHRLPFEALIFKEGAHGLADSRFWIDENGGPPIRYTASATSLARLIERSRQETRDAEAGQSSILSVSDPVFSWPATAGQTRGASGQREESERSGFILAPLPSTAIETKAILSSFGGAGVPVAIQTLQRGQADERHVRAAVAGKRWIHLATHGIVTERRNGLFAALALTPPSRGAVTPDDDGFLELREIYQLRLDCELAVLSACRTAFGAPQPGEGVFSLARGFHVAGAKRVVATLWPVADDTTALLMADYFRRIATMKRVWRDPPSSYTGELFAAKKAIAKAATSRDPFFWAPFILSGEP